MVAVRALTVLAILLALVGMHAYWVAHTALDASGFETVSRNMIEDDAIREQVANTAVDGLYANVDVEAAIAARLPPAQKGLAPVLAGLSRSGADRVAVTALERPRVQSAWVATTTATQRQLVRLLDDKTKFQTEGGKVVLDLRPIIIQIGDQVAVIGRVAEKLPDSAGKITIIEVKPTGHGPDGHADPARGRRLDVACCTGCRGACGLAGPRASKDRAPRAGDRSVRRRAPDAGRAQGHWRLSRRPTREGRQRQAGGTNAWNILTQTLADRAWVWITLGLILLFGVWFVGDTRLAVRARRAAQPTLENRWAAYGIVVGFVLILALIAPLFARGWLASLVTLALLIAGVEVVRNIVQREAQLKS